MKKFTEYYRKRKIEDVKDLDQEYKDSILYYSEQEMKKYIRTPIEDIIKKINDMVNYMYVGDFKLDSFKKEEDVEKEIKLFIDYLGEWVYDPEYYIRGDVGIPANVFCLNNEKYQKKLIELDALLKTYILKKSMLEEE